MLLRAKKGTADSLCYKLMKIMNAVFVFVKFVQFYLLIQTIFNIYRNKLVVYLSFVVLMTLYSEIC